jgi:hypothetical protein
MLTIQVKFQGFCYFSHVLYIAIVLHSGIVNLLAFKTFYLSTLTAYLLDFTTIFYRIYEYYLKYNNNLRNVK